MMYADLRQYQPELIGAKIVYVVELGYRMSTEGVEVRLRLDDGREVVGRRAARRFEFDADVSGAKEIGLVWEDSDMPMQWLQLDPALEWPLIVEARLAPLLGPAPIPKRLRIEGEALVPTWPRRGERGAYVRE